MNLCKATPKISGNFYRSFHQYAQFAMLVIHHHTCQVYLRTFQLIFQNFYKFCKFAEIREIDPSRQDVSAADPAVMKMFTRTNGAIDGNRHFKKNFFLIEWKKTQ